MAITTTQLTNGLHNGNEANGDASNALLDIAIVGSGIVGVMMALGLLHRGMRVTVYERANDFHEIGAGFAFTGVARECMQRLDPRVLEALRRVGEENRHPQNRYWDGFNPASKEAAQAQDALLFQMSARDLAYWGCLRSHLLREMVGELPEGVTKFGKQLESYVDDESSNKVVLRFADGSVAEADAGLSALASVCHDVPDFNAIDSHRLRRNPLAHPADAAGRGQPGLARKLHPQGRLSRRCAHRRRHRCPRRR